MKVYLDTNVLVSAFTARGLSADVFRIVLLEHELLTGEVNLTELEPVLTKRLRVPRAQVANVLRLLHDHTIVAKPASLPEISVRDPDDQWVLASAMAGTADVLVTGDQDLLVLDGIATLPILSPRAFWELLRRTK